MYQFECVCCNNVRFKVSKWRIKKNEVHAWFLIKRNLMHCNQQKNFVSWLAEFIFISSQNVAPYNNYDWYVFCCTSRHGLTMYKIINLIAENHSSRFDKQKYNATKPFIEYWMCNFYGIIIFMHLRYNHNCSELPCFSNLSHISSCNSITVNWS